MKYNNLSTTHLKLRASFMTYLKPLAKFHKKCFIHDLKQNSNLINGCKWFTWATVEVEVPHDSILSLLFFCKIYKSLIS